MTRAEILDMIDRCRDDLDELEAMVDGFGDEPDSLVESVNWHQMPSAVQ